MKILREIGWFLGTLLLSFAIYHWLFDLRTLFTGIAVEIHDTYFVVGAPSPILLVVIVIFFAVNLCRAAVARFRDMLLNTLFLIVNAFMIALLVFISIFFRVATQPPPLSAIPPDTAPNVMFYIFAGLALILFCVELNLAFRTFGRNTKKF